MHRKLLLFTAKGSRQCGHQLSSVYSLTGCVQKYLKPPALAVIPFNLLTAVWGQGVQQLRCTFDPRALGSALWFPFQLTGEMYRCHQ